MGVGEQGEGERGVNAINACLVMSLPLDSPLFWEAWGSV